MLLSRRPTGPLGDVVETLWASERGAAAHAQERNLPTGRFDIVIPLLDGQCLTRFECDASRPGASHRGPIVQGAQDRPWLRGTGAPSCVVGVHFKPGGAARLFGGATAELGGHTELLTDVLGPEVHKLQEQLQSLPHARARLQALESWLVARLIEAPPADAMVQSALHAMARQPADVRIDVLQRASGCNPARFIARFEQAVGLTPKRYARVLRFHALIERLARRRPDDWAQAALQAGYADQSHLIHEFKRLAGITPTAYRAIAPDQPTHAQVGGR